MLLRELRSAKGLSLNQLARRSKISPATLSNWENKRHLPNPDRLARIFDVLDTPIHDRARILELVRRQSTKPEGSGCYVAVCGDLIAGLRLRRGYSEVELAEAVGVTDRMVRKWETGESLPSEGSRERAIEFLRADSMTAKAIRSKTIAEVSALHPLCLAESAPENLFHLLANLWNSEGDLCAFYCVRAALWNRPMDTYVSEAIYETHFMGGNRMWTMGHLEEAQRWWKRVLQLHEREWLSSPNFGSAIVLRRMNDLSRSMKLTADRLVEDIHKLDCFRAWPIAVASRAYASAGEEKLALHYADMHSGVWPSEQILLGVKEASAEPTHFRANVLIRLGRNREVLDLTEDQAGRGLDLLFTLSLRSQAALAIGDFILAKKCLDEATAFLAKFPDWPQWVEARSKAYMDYIWLAPLREGLKNRTESSQVGNYRDWPDS